MLQQLTKKYKVTMYLKNGKQLRVYCNDWKFDRDNATGVYSGYRLKGTKTYPYMSVSIPELSGFKVKKTFRGLFSKK